MSKDVLAKNLTDQTVAVVNFLADLIPGGGLFATLFTEIIPNQRQDRIVEFIKELSNRIDTIEDYIEKLKHPQYIDIFEDSCYAIIRAVSEERKKYILNLLIKGLSAEEVEIIKFKKLFAILHELNDIEILILYVYYKAQSGDYSLIENNQILKELFEEKNTKTENGCLLEAYITKLVILNLLDTKGYFGLKFEEPNEEKKTPYNITESISALGNYFIKNILFD